MKKIFPNTAGTSENFVILEALGIKPDNELVVTPMSFIAMSNKIIHAGVISVFAHVETATGNIVAEKIESAITEKIKAVILGSL